MIRVVFLALYVLSEVLSIGYRGRFGFLRPSEQPIYYRRISYAIQLLNMVSVVGFIITSIVVRSYLGILLIILTAVVIERCLYRYCFLKAIRMERDSLLRSFDKGTLENLVTNEPYTREEIIEMAPQIVISAINDHERVF